MKDKMRTLLLVDDDDAFRTAIGAEIAENGRYVITSADSGEAALQALQHDTFDVIILDYRMPGISGLNVLQWINEQKIDTPVVMLTAAGSEMVAVEAMKLGAYDYVRKDQIDIDHIVILIDGVIERHSFKKEKALRVAIERERERNLLAIETYHSTLSSIAQMANNSLSMVSLNIGEYKSRLKPYVTDDGWQQFAQVFNELNKEYRVVATTVKAILDMANILHGNFSHTNYLETMQELMNANTSGILGRGESISSAAKPEESGEAKKKSTIVSNNKEGQ